MENEITFRTSVGGYRRDEVIEYVESMNEQIFCLKRKAGSCRKLQGKNSRAGDAFGTKGSE